MGARPPWESTVLAGTPPPPHVPRSMIGRPYKCPQPSLPRGPEEERREREREGGRATPTPVAQTTGQRSED